jgi:hypothetical protein
MAAAPTVPFTLPRQTPGRILQKLLAGLGDRSLIRGRVTGDSDTTYLHLRPRTRPPGVRAVRSGWEQTIVAGAFRDLLCAARAPLLWSWTGLDGGPLPMLDQRYAYQQRFPSPTQRVFRERLAVVARRWHFRVLDARYLRPLQGAPMVVVETAHPLRLARVAAKVQRFLDPLAPGRRFQLGAWAYEGFYFEVEDAENVPAFAIANAFRGTGSGSQWARSETLYPFPHG